MQIDRVTRRDPATWRLETVYLGQHVNFTLSHDDVLGVVEGENPSEAHVVDALRENRDDLEAAVKAVVGNDGTPPAKFGSLAVDRSPG